MKTILGLAVSVLAGASAAQEHDPEPEPIRPRFEFHVSFWLNLHHALYERAITLRDGGQLAIRDDAWIDAVAHYTESLIARDLLTDEGMLLDDWRLGTVPDDEPLDGVEIDLHLARALTSAAPIYRDKLWSEHRNESEAWIEKLEPLVREYADPIGRELEELLREPFPKEPIRVDVLNYANWAGAYTSKEPNHIRIQPFAPGEKPHDAFETLMHEATHTLLTRKGPIPRGIAAAAERERVIAGDLWHAILFHTCGEVVRRSDVTPAGWVPYAHRHGLWARGPWMLHREVLDAHWSPYVAGETEFEPALDAVVAALSETTRKRARGGW